MLNKAEDQISKQEDKAEKSFHTKQQNEKRLNGFKGASGKHET